MRVPAHPSRGAVALVAVALAGMPLAACGGTSEARGELVAVPYPAQEDDEGAAVDDADPGAQEPVAPPDADAAVVPPSAGPEAAATDEVVDGGVPLADIRAFLDAREEGVDARDHLLADLTQDGTHELAVAIVSDGRARVEIARWDGDRLALAERRGVGPADQIGRLRLVDPGAATRRLLILPLRHEGALTVAVWAPAEDGGLRSPSDCPLDGVVALRSSVGQRHELRCEAGPVPDALVWDGAAFKAQALLDDPAASAVDDGQSPRTG